MRGKFNSKRLVRVLVVLALCSCMIASIYVDVFASDSHLGKSNINTSGAFFSRTGQFDVLHYYGNSGDKFTISSTDVPSDCTIVGAYAVSYFRMSGHDFNCGHKIQDVTITKPNGSTVTVSGSKIYCDRRWCRNAGTMQWDYKSYGMTAVDVSSAITKTGEYKCDVYKYSDDHNTTTAGELFWVYEVFVLVKRPTSKITAFGIEGGAVSGYYDEREYKSSLTATATDNELKIGGGNVSVYTAKIQDGTKPSTAVSIGDSAVSLSKTTVSIGQDHTFDLECYSGTTNKTGTSVTLKNTDVSLFDTTFGFTYAIETASPVVTHTQTMGYVDANNPESGIEITGKVVNATAESLADTGLRGDSTLVVTVGSGLTVKSASATFNDDNISSSKISISGNIVTINISKKFINTRTENKDDYVTYKIICSQNSSASQAQFNASHVLSGKVRSMGINTSYQMSFPSSITMNARYRCNLSGVNTSRVSVSSNKGETSATGVFNYGATATISGIAKEGYHISSWSDGNTTGANTLSGSRTVSIMSNCNYVIYAEANNYRVDYNSGSSNH